MSTRARVWVCVCLAASPVCGWGWDLRTPADTKARPHRLHLKGFSPVCERMCCFRWLDFLKPLLHQLHLGGKHGTLRA